MAKKIGNPVAWHLAGDYQNPLKKELEIQQHNGRLNRSVRYRRNAIVCLVIAQGQLV